MNNWSVNQPSVPHDKGMAGNEDLGMSMIVNGVAVNVAQKEANEDLSMTIGGTEHASGSHKVVLGQNDKVPALDNAALSIAGRLKM
jgi:hypothetical protein